MEIRVLEPRRIVKHVARVMVGDLEVTYDLLDLLEDLARCDGFAQRLVIHDSDSAKLLEKHGLAEQSARGSWYRGPRLEQWLKDAHAASISTELAKSAQMARGL